MISKQNRLKEKEVKKVLQRWKPFFSYGIVLNYTKNRLDHNRFGIVIWWKSVINNIHRSYFRRRFYDLASQVIETNNNQQSYDLVFVVKKQTKLDKNSQESYTWFIKDIKFLLGKIFKNNK